MESENNLLGSNPLLATVLDKLGSYTQQFRLMSGYIQEFISMPAYMFNRSHLDIVIEDLRGESGLFEEAESFLYLIHTLSVFEYGLQSDDLVQAFLEAVRRTRSSGVKNELIESQAGKGRRLMPGVAIMVNPRKEIDEHSDVVDVLDNNRVALAIFIFSLVSVLSRASEVERLGRRKREEDVPDQQQKRRIRSF